jgi:uncharacterized protein (DUF302 family)
MKILVTMFVIMVVGIMTSGIVAYAQAPDRVDKVSNSNFEKTVKQIETALQKRGFMIVATLDHQNMLTMVGVNIKGSKTIEFGKPDMGKMVLPGSPEAGLEMPAKIYIWESGDGKTVVSYYKPSSDFNKYGKEDLKKVGEMMDKMLDEVTTEGTK